MATIKLEPTTLIWSLTLLLKSLAEAIEWVCKQAGEVELEVPDFEGGTPPPPKGPVSAGCDRCPGGSIPPKDIYLAVRKAMSKKNEPGSKTKPNLKRPK